MLQCGCTHPAACPSLTLLASHSRPPMQPKPISPHTPWRRHPCRWWLEALLRRAPGTLPTWRPQELVQLAWALATLQAPPAPRCARALLWAASDRSVDFKMREWATLLWALAAMGLQPSVRWLRRAHVRGLVGGRRGRACLYASCNS